MYLGSHLVCLSDLIRHLIRLCILRAQGKHCTQFKRRREKRAADMVQSPSLVVSLSMWLLSISGYASDSSQVSSLHGSSGGASSASSLSGMHPPPSKRRRSQDQSLTNPSRIYQPHHLHQGPIAGSASGALRASYGAAGRLGAAIGQPGPGLNGRSYSGSMRLVKITSSGSGNAGSNEVSTCSVGVEQGLQNMDK